MPSNICETASVQMICKTPNCPRQVPRNFFAELYRTSDPTAWTASRKSFRSLWSLKLPHMTPSLSSFATSSEPTKCLLSSNSKMYCLFVWFKILHYVLDNGVVVL